MLGYQYRTITVPYLLSVQKVEDQYKVLVHYLFVTTKGGTGTKLSIWLIDLFDREEW